MENIKHRKNDSILISETIYSKHFIMLYYINSQNINIINKYENIICELFENVSEFSYTIK